MTALLSPYIPFAPISWWAAALHADILQFDSNEPFKKMTVRNRYYIVGANGIVRLSIPILHGREQRLPMKEIRISNTDRWQTQHWRTIVSAYRRAPYFTFYEPELAPLFQKQFEWLIDFNEETFQWFQNRLKLPITTQATQSNEATSAHDTRDLRNFRPKHEGDSTPMFPQYYQVFADRLGFIPDLSLLDLFFAEGPGTSLWLKQQQAVLLNH